MNLRLLLEEVGQEGSVLRAQLPGSTDKRLDLAEALEEVRGPHCGTFHLRREEFETVVVEYLPEILIARLGVPHLRCQLHPEHEWDQTLVQVGDTSLRHRRLQLPQLPGSATQWVEVVLGQTGLRQIGLVRLEWNVLEIGLEAVEWESLSATG